MPKLAVLGQPVAHSRSPAMQNAALRALGLDGEWGYEAIEVAPDEFEARVRAMAADGFAGANVTVPHKLAALALADRASEAAAAIGAANTLSFSEGAIEAENTDAPGLIAALPEPPEGARALVLGAGGSARACAWALREAGAAVSVWNRTAARAAELASELGLTAVEPAVDEGGVVDRGDFDLLVNCTTVGLAEANASGTLAGAPADLKPLPIDADGLDATHVVVDLVYGPSPTPLALAARSRGASFVDGLEVLVHQGAASLRIWTGLDPPIEAMRTAARAF
jgi:shikimate dehydrogenase